MKEIKLTKGMVALVDDEDYDKVNAFKWYASNESRGTKWYAVRWITDKTLPKVSYYKDGQLKYKNRKVKVRMHRFVLDLPALAGDGLVVDHVNDAGLDNQKKNLQVITQAENMDKVKTWKRKKEEPSL